MKILVPTDFSDQAQIAIDVALKIAQRVKGEIHFFHCAENLPAGWSGWPLRERDEEPNFKKIHDKLKEKIKKMESLASQQGVLYKSKIDSGNFLTAITAYEPTYDFDMIVMGSHGASGKQEYFIGSNTQKVIRKLHTNILIVKEPIEKIDFEKVIFATDLSPADREAFNIFLSYLKVFNTTEVHIVTIDTPGFITQPRALVDELQKDFKKMAAALDCKTHFIRSFTVEEGIRNYSEDLGVSLIGISNLQRHPIKRIFSGSNVEMLANHTNIPVLSLDGKLLT